MTETETTSPTPPPAAPVGATALPPPPASSRRTPPPPSTGPGDAPPSPAPGRPWRDRLPELVGAIGTVLVLAALVGFVSSSWEQLDRYGRALVLLGAAGGLTGGALAVEARGQRALDQLVSMLWVAATGAVAASATLALTELLDGRSRVAVAVAGLLAAGHALAGARRSPGAAVREAGVVGALLFAAGPFGTSLTDRFGVDDLARAFEPVFALLVRPLASDDFALTGALHLLVAGGWLLWAHRSTGASARLGWVGGTVVATYAALELHAVPSGIGAFGALLVVLGYLVLGLVTDRGGVVAVGTTGVLVAGSRVLFSLFSGEVATTIASLVVGLLLLAWAVRARSGQDDAATGVTSDSPAGRTDAAAPAAGPGR